MEQSNYVEGYAPDNCWMGDGYVTDAFTRKVRSVVQGSEYWSQVNDIVMTRALRSEVDPAATLEDVAKVIANKAVRLLLDMDERRYASTDREVEYFLISVLGWDEYCRVLGIISTGARLPATQVYRGDAGYPIKVVVTDVALERKRDPVSVQRNNGFVSSIHYISSYGDDAFPMEVGDYAAFMHKSGRNYHGHISSIYSGGFNLKYLDAFMYREISVSESDLAGPVAYYSCNCNDLFHRFNEFTPDSGKYCIVDTKVGRYIGELVQRSYNYVVLNVDGKGYVRIPAEIMDAIDIRRNGLKTMFDNAVGSSKPGKMYFDYSPNLIGYPSICSIGNGSSARPAWIMQWSQDGRVLVCEKGDSGAVCLTVLDTHTIRTEDPLLNEYMKDLGTGLGWIGENLCSRNISVITNNSAYCGNVDKALPTGIILTYEGGKTFVPAYEINCITS